MFLITILLFEKVELHSGYLGVLTGASTISFISIFGLIPMRRIGILLQRLMMLSGLGYILYLYADQQRNKPTVLNLIIAAIGVGILYMIQQYFLKQISNKSYEIPLIKTIALIGCLCLVLTCYNHFQALKAS